MKYLQDFKDYLNLLRTKLVTLGIKNWTVNKDGLVDVEGDCYLNDRSLKKLPVKFGRVTGDFICERNELTTLEGAPHYIGGGFFCARNKLKDLKGGPKNVMGRYVCAKNELTSLEGAPETIHLDFICHFNKLTNLKGSPRFVEGNFYCQGNKLTSLQFGPVEINGPKRYVSSIIPMPTAIIHEPEDLGELDELPPHFRLPRAMHARGARLPNPQVSSVILPNPISNLPKEYLNHAYLDFILCNQSDWSLYKKDGSVYLNRLEEMIEWGLETNKIKPLS
jgi:hypothetical protein